VWEGERDGAFLRLVALGRRDGPDGGFSLLDATDPRNITLVAQYPGLANYDVEFTHDGRYVFFTTQWLPSEQQTGQPDPLHDQRAIYIVDLADLAAPEPAGLFYPPPRGAHTLSYHRTEQGRELLFANAYDFLPDPSLHLPVSSLGGNPVAHRTFILEFVREAPPRLEVLSIYQKTDQLAAAGQTFFPHDSFTQRHPVTGELLLYLSYWDLGMFLVNIDDPANPRDVAQLQDFQPSQHANIHYARPAPELIDGVHVTITAPELGPTDESGQYTLFDTTDPANPRRLGYWELPGDIVITEGLNFSPHNFDIANGRLYLAHYHGGVWVVDIHDRALLDRPATLGYWQHAIEGGKRWPLAPDFWSVFLRDGLLYASDKGAGLHVLRFALDEPGRGEPAQAN
jgi:hypothetical protein